jgi:hypothetical protein
MKLSVPFNNPLLYLLPNRVINWITEVQNYDLIIAPRQYNNGY